MYRALINLLVFIFQTIRVMFLSKTDLIIENLMLRQQLATYQARKKRPKNITDFTRAFLIAVKTTWSNWVDVLVIVKPETIISWQKQQFKNHWAKIW